ncbi:methylenetetrahydrofolate reductase [Candidatus Chloroploca sp. Khr17]|uniref:methylenetetrahydrofolate reductase n=1 Tax=Candidatus Chloroploca sp. Khr17 TaxID=2496869 RepID=UPI00101B8D6C|nr:hypothetical protein [Candidatus Chloroploca sp. Khr17]
MHDHTPFNDKLIHSRQFVTLYGTTPPRADSSLERVETAAAKLAGRVAGLDLDGLVVYDVQDEHERTSEPRPFPFLPTRDPRDHSRRLRELTGLPAVTYKCVVNFTEADWLAWLDETASNYGIEHLSLVGASTPTPDPRALPVDRALELTARHDEGFVLGGVMIAERHSPDFDESRRLIAKAERGCRYFISQVVYDPAPTIRLLRDYREACRRADANPQRLVLTFSPCGRPQTLTFIKWLGIAIPPATERMLCEDPAPFQKSIAICCANLRTILDQAYREDLALGINIESVSIHHDEIEASIELVHALRAVAAEYGL